MRLLHSSMIRTPITRVTAHKVSSRLLHQTAHCQGPQHSLPAAYYRGGTSRAVIFSQQDLPEDRTKWSHIFRQVIGSPDPNGRQLDGMGGGVSSLSKVCIVGPSTHKDADVDYTFAAIGVKTTEVDFSSNCGNMTAAIGPFAIDSGLLKPKAATGSAVVKIHNVNTGKIIHATFPIENDGTAAADGDFAIDGVAGAGAKIQLSFINPAGSKTGKTLPTGSVVDEINGVKATCIDVGNPCVFVPAAELGIEGGMLADAIEARPDILSRLEAIRRKASVKMGISSTEEATPGSIPKIAMVSAPHKHVLISGQTVGDDYCDLVVRAISVGQPHRAVPITVAMALAVASRLEGSTVQRCTADSKVDSDGVTIGHNSGRILVGAKFNDNGEVTDATVFRTARRIMDGLIYWK